MKRKKLEKRIKKVFHNRIIGFSSPEKEERLIVDVISVLSNRNITISRAVEVLNDSAKIIPLIKDF